MSHGKQYYLLMLSLNVLRMALVAAFNFAIDFYKLLHTDNYVGLKAKKKEIFYQLGTTKTYQF
jgi:hypothetical protein